MADKQPKFIIDGNPYPVPEMDTLTMGEALVVEEYTGLGLDQLDEIGVRPSAIAALMHIAYARGNPDLSKRQVRELVESAKLVDALDSVTEEEDERPPASPQTSDEPETDENENGEGSRPGSGADSTNGSDHAVVGLSRIGTRGSATSAT